MCKSTKYSHISDTHEGSFRCSFHTALRVVVVVVVVVGVDECDPLSRQLNPHPKAPPAITVSSGSKITSL